jgi:hypothetical protein
MRDLGIAQTLGDNLGAGVAGAADDDREPGRRLAKIVAGVRELDLPGQVIAHIQRLGMPWSRARAGPRADRRQLVQAAGGQHQPVVWQPAAATLRIGVRDPAAVQLDLAIHA